MCSSTERYGSPRHTGENKMFESAVVGSAPVPIYPLERQGRRYLWLTAFSMIYHHYIRFYALLKEGKHNSKNDISHLVAGIMTLFAEVFL